MRTSHEDPFGNPIRLTGTGTIAKDNPFRFSTKRAEDNTGIVLYEYRAYSPTLGRWTSRDPIGENGGLHSYAFVLNDPISLIDKKGLCISGDTRGLKCIPAATPYGYTPENDETWERASRILEHLGTAEKVLSVAAVLVVTRGIGIQAGLEDAIVHGAAHVTTEAAHAAVESFYETIRNSGTTGYSAFTKVEWEYCKPGVCWNSWEPYDTGWLQVNEGGNNDRGWFTDLNEAFLAASRECDARMAIFRRNNRVSE